MTIADPIAIPRPEGPLAEAPAPRPLAEALVLADGVELIGEYEGSGFKEPPLLARRADGQMIQLSRVLYLVAAACDGRRDAESVAAVVTERYGRRVSLRNVRHIVDRKLRPLGVLALADGTTPVLPKREPVMALRHRKPIVPERCVNGVARGFVWLHRPLVQIVLLAALAAFDAWLFGVHGIAGGLRAVLYSPMLLLGLLGSIVVATAFHELGHASACRYGGARPGVMGVGIYLVWPAFYCDVTESYRLNRPARLRTDLGGVYFNGIFALLAGLAYFPTGQEALLLVAFVQHTIVLQQLLPLLRFDGYYVLSDLTGVPDILSRVKPILRSLVPHWAPEPRVQELKPWVRVVVTTYLLVLIPTLLFMITATVIAGPRIAATAFDSFGVQLDRLGAAHATPQLVLGAVQIGALALPLGAIAVSLGRTGRMAARAVGSWSRDSAPRRAVAVAATAALAAGLAYTWWPNGDYQPIRPAERGTIGDALRGLKAIASERPSFAMQRAVLLGSASTVSEQSAARPRDAARQPSATTTAHTAPRAVAPGGGDPPASRPGEQGPAPAPGREPGAVTRPPAASSPSRGHAPPAPATTAATGPSSPVAAGATGATPTAPATASAAPTDTTSPPSAAPTETTSPPSPPATDDASSPATDSGARGANTAIAVNKTDGARLVRVAFDLAWVDATTVDNLNAAIAVASCTSCTTVAIAIQAVLVFGQPRVFMPMNLAVALNEACTDCQTLASAYQDVVQLSAPAHLSAAGTQRVEAVRQALATLAESGLPIAEIQQHVDALHREVVAILGTELVPDDPSTPPHAPVSSSEPADAAPAGAPTPDPSSPADASASPPAVEDTETNRQVAQPPGVVAPEAAPGDSAASADSGDEAATGPAADPAPPADSGDPAPPVGSDAATEPTPAGSGVPVSPAPAPPSAQAVPPASPSRPPASSTPAPASSAAPPASSTAPPASSTTPPASSTPSPPPPDAAPPAASTSTTTDPTSPSTLAAPPPPTTP
jgi:putative peptide zinc metalloprotease protein